MKKNFFIAGTDTDIGKTLVAEALLVKAGQQGLRTVGLKPIAAGSIDTPDGRKNEDAIALQRAATENLSYEQVNPVLLDAAIAPHIAAELEGRRVTISSLTGFYQG